MRAPGGAVVRRRWLAAGHGWRTSATTPAVCGRRCSSASHAPESDGAERESRVGRRCRLQGARTLCPATRRLPTSPHRLWVWSPSRSGAKYRANRCGSVIKAAASPTAETAPLGSPSVEPRPEASPGSPLPPGALTPIFWRDGARPSPEAGVPAPHEMTTGGTFFNILVAATIPSTAPGAGRIRSGQCSARSRSRGSPDGCVVARRGGRRQPSCLPREGKVRGDALVERHRRPASHAHQAASAEIGPQLRRFGRQSRRPRARRGGGVSEFESGFQPGQSQTLGSARRVSSCVCLRVRQKHQ